MAGLRQQERPRHQRGVQTDIHRAMRSWRQWADYTLKTLGRSTLQYLRGRGECDNLELALSQQSGRQTTEPTSEHQTPLVLINAVNSLPPKGLREQRANDQLRAR